jgi:hypothetical protein
LTPVVPHVTPRATRPTRPTRPTLPAQSGAAPIGHPVSPAATHVRPLARHHAARRLVAPAPRRGTSRAALSFPSSIIATDLLRLTSGLRAGASARPGDGVLLLLSSLAMAALAVSSFMLLRRLKRFGGGPG